MLAFEEIIKPVAEEFSPDFVAISAGQDNHFTDPITDLALTARGYAEIMREAVKLSERFCSGRLVAVLEGGYSVEGALGSSIYEPRNNSCNGRDGHFSDQRTEELSEASEAKER